MDEFVIVDGAWAHGGRLLMVSATGNVNLDTAQSFYSDLRGWSRDTSGWWQTTGDDRHVSLINANGEKLVISIYLRSGETKLSIFYDRSAPT
jgi:hypothetical protein